MTKIKDVCGYLNNIAPPALQESYDNATLITGNGSDEVTSILITLDTTEAVVEEAITLGANLIVSHHPIVFKGLTSLTGKNYVERTVIKAIQNNIAIYACHTNLDNVQHGVNKKICDLLELKNTKILVPKKNTLKRLTTYTPKAETSKVLEALHNAGAGMIGNYKNCSFITEGEGRFKPNEHTQPHIGTQNQLETVDENCIDVLVPSHLEGNIINALQMTHPYEEVAYYLTSVENKNQEIGSGMIGTLSSPMKIDEFWNHLKGKFNLKTFRHTPIIKPTVSKIAVCGGSGSFLLRNAIAKNADVFITADFKYHEFFDAENKIVISDIGHYESEVFTKDLFFEIISEKFTNIALHLSKTNTNPIVYV